MTFSLISITHDATRKPPLTAVFTVAGAEYQVDIDGGQLESFCSFRRVVANRLGMWFRAPQLEELANSEAKRVWGNMVEDAFQARRARS